MYTCRAAHVLCCAAYVVLTFGDADSRADQSSISGTKRGLCVCVCMKWGVYVDGVCNMVCTGKFTSQHFGH